MSACAKKQSAFSQMTMCVQWKERASEISQKKNTKKKTENCVDGAQIFGQCVGILPLLCCARLTRSYLFRHYSCVCFLCHKRRRVMLGGAAQLFTHLLSEMCCKLVLMLRSTRHCTQYLHGLVRTQIEKKKRRRKMEYNQIEDQSCTCILYCATVSSLSAKRQTFFAYFSTEFLLLL